jgi:hypothetical protein
MIEKKGLGKKWPNIVWMGQKRMGNEVIKI